MKQKVLFIIPAVFLLLAFAVGALFYTTQRTDATTQLPEEHRAILSRMHSPTLGNIDAKVQIVEFLDPACETCRSFYLVVVPRILQVGEISGDERKALQEDLQVLESLINKAIVGKNHSPDVNMALGLTLYRAEQASYLTWIQDSGLLYQRSLSGVSLAPRSATGSKKDSAKTDEPESEWDAARRELAQFEEAEFVDLIGLGFAGNQRLPAYDEETVESLKKRVAGALKNVGRVRFPKSSAGIAQVCTIALRAVRHLFDLPSAASIGDFAGRRAVARTGPRKIDSTTAPGIFENRIATQVISPIISAISGPSIARGTSFLKDRLGQRILPAGVDLVDDPFRVRGLGSTPIDDEGVAVSRQSIVQDGVLTTWLLNSAAAAQLGLASTGHASRGLAGPPGLSTHNLHLEPGERDLAGLMADAGTGLLPAGP